MSPSDRQQLPAALTRAGPPVSRFARQPSARIRLVCFPHAGGGPAVFARWAYQLAPETELWNAVLPGRPPRAHERFTADWADLVREFADEIGESVPRPYALLGQSLGAAIAFEVSRELGTRGSPPVHLFVSASAAPDRRPGQPVPEDDQALIRLVDERYGGLPPAVRAEPELLGYFLPVLRADLRLASAYRYRPGAALGVPLTVFAGDRDPTVPAAGAAGWARHTTADCEVHLLDGGHFCLNDHEPRVLSIIRRRLRPAPPASD